MEKVDEGKSTGKTAAEDNEHEEQDEEDNFHTPRGRDMAGEAEVEWMYADSGILPLPGMRALAEANPLRWSRGTPDKIVVELDSVGCSWWARANSQRPVQLRVVGTAYVHKFQTAAAAAQWLRECECECEERADTSADRATTIAAYAAKVLAAPALALYCRVHSKQPWARKNIFFAGSYALRACSVPQQVSRMQELHSPWHPRKHASWADWHRSTARSLMPFVEAAQRPLGSRPASLRCVGVVYYMCAQHSSPFWVTYSSSSSDSRGSKEKEKEKTEGKKVANSQDLTSTNRKTEEKNEVAGRPAPPHARTSYVVAIGGTRCDDESLCCHPASPARCSIYSLYSYKSTNTDTEGAARAFILGAADALAPQGPHVRRFYSLIFFLVFFLFFFVVCLLGRLFWARMLPRRLSCRCSSCATRRRSAQVC